MSEKHLDFEIEPVNTIRTPEIEYTQTPQALVPIDNPLSIIRKHIPRQSDIDKIVRNIETHVIHSARSFCLQFGGVGLCFCWYFFCLYLTFGECCESVP